MPLTEISTIQAAEVNFEIKRGDTFGPITLEFYTQTDPNDDTTQVPIDVSSDEFVMHVVTSRGATPVMTLTIGNGFEYGSAVHKIVMLKDNTYTDIPGREYIHGMKRMQALGGPVTTEMEGKFTIKDDRK